ncbi:hypothetical protein ACFU7Y_15855 [Kitasatospora sp. NPDC057542]|uniref:hypothetical protein n=1 Tax=Kitasatospora sp. NPDC057542 TaxID=3346162 RepID=UPI00369304D0
MPEQTDPYAYAPVDTLLGLLQRGRGLGALQASEDPVAAADAVYACIRTDWRWDWLVDEHRVYLARLLRDLDLPLGPVADALATADDHDAEEAARILERLALAGSAEARDILRAYIREGEQWLSVLESVSERWPVEWWEDLGDVARARLGGDDDPTPWAKAWEHWGVSIPTPERKPPKPDPPAEPTNAELLEIIAAPGSSEDRRMDAMYVLHHHRDPEPGLVPLVPSLGTADGKHSLPLVTGLLARLGAHAMPAARDWAASGTRWLAREGLRVLAGHGEPQDVPVLLAQLEKDWAHRTWCGPMLMAQGLARLGPEAAGAVPFLRRFWVRTPHSYERPAYLRALAAIDPAGLDEAYVESLWDSQAEARLLGVERAPDRPGVRERLAYLRDDPMEESEVREAAGARLAGPARAPLPADGEAVRGGLE